MHPARRKRSRGRGWPEPKKRLAFVMSTVQQPPQDARKGSLSWDRDRHLQALGAKVFDLLVVGGGATGCSVARDAALRGLDVCLVERGDLAAGTSSRSTRFIHGGLRYLKTFEFGFVREGLQERSTLMTVAPHLVRPMEFLFPALPAAGMSRLKVRFGIGLYDLLAGRNRLPGTRSLSLSQTLLLEPCLRGTGLRGSVVYRDGATDDARLVVETAVSAVEAGATVAVHVEVQRVVPSETGPAVLVLRDRLTGAPLGARSAVVINAAGAWAGDLLRSLPVPSSGPIPGNRLRPSRGSHLVVSREHLPISRVVVMPSRADGRLLFAVPAGEFTILGTTEVDHTSPLDPVRADASEVDYILNVAGEIFESGPIPKERIRCTWAGIRPLVERPQTETGRLSRDFRVLQEAPGVVTVVGGKLTSCRRMAEATLDLATRILSARTGRRADRCITGWKLFPGSEGRVPEGEDRPAEMDMEVANHLRSVYGSRASLIFRRIAQAPSLGKPFDAGCPATPAEVIHAVEREGAVRLADLLFRRLHPLTMEARMKSTQGRAVADGASRVMASWLGWTEERRLKEISEASLEWERDFSVPLKP